jgi:protein-tyrosine kinase
MSKLFKALERAEREKVRSLGKARESLAHKELYEDEVLELFDQIPSIKAVPDPEPFQSEIIQWLIAYSDPGSMVAEQIKRIRTHILHYAQNDKPPRTIMITSAMPGEGKSLIAANLAVSLAQGIEQYVLLVDSDIRSPQVHSYFGQSPGLGLSDYLNGEAELSKIFRQTGIPKLSYISGGSKKSNPAELLSSNRMRELVHEIRERYDDRFILFDSSPVLLTNEPAILTKIVDGALFVVRQNITRRDALQKGLSFMLKEKILGLVFNDYVTDLPLYDNYTYKSYYGKYGPE